VLILSWFLLSIAVAVAASRRGRLGFAWFLLALAFSPVIAGLFVLLLPERTAEAESREGRVPCRYCRELIRPDAVVCPFCRKDYPLSGSL
jgi:hypothetical protein